MSSPPIRGPRGERVYLRPLEPDDAELVHRWYEDVRFRTTMGDSPISLARRRRRYEDATTRHDEDVYRFVICRIVDDVPVGRADLFLIDRTNGSCGFGLGVGDPALRGQGLGTDAVNALVDFAFGEMRMERVWLDTEASNARAQATYRRAGFIEEGRLRHAWFMDGAFVDGVRMSLLRDEWLALPRSRSWELAAKASAGE